MKREIFIKCPHCGAEYLPAEIFYPNSLLGKPADIEKTATGTIDCYNGSNMNLVEEYMCDNCDTTFAVRAQVNFFTRIIEEKSFEKNYKTKIKKEKFTLDEE